MHFKYEQAQKQASRPSGSSFLSQPSRPFKIVGNRSPQPNDTIQLCPKCKNPKCKSGELCTPQYGSKKRQEKRKDQIQELNKLFKEQESWKKRSDFLVDKHGRVFKSRQGVSTGFFFQTSRQKQQSMPEPEGNTLTLDTSSLKSMSQGVLNISKKYTKDPNTSFTVTTPSKKKIGSIKKANAPWFRIPQWSTYNPSMPSSFSIPTGTSGTKLGSTYGKNEGIFSQKSISSNDELSLGRRLLVSGSESVRGTGGGLGQVIGLNLFKGKNKPRNVLYGTGKNPGLIPTTYSGSQVDIVLTENESLRKNWKKTQSNPVGIQIENILGMQRRQRYKRKPRRLKRSLSNPDLTATLELHEKDTKELMDELGLSLKPTFNLTPRKRKRLSSKISRVTSQPKKRLRKIKDKKKK